MADHVDRNYALAAGCVFNCVPSCGIAVLLNPAGYEIHVDKLASAHDRRKKWPGFARHAIVSPSKIIRALHVQIFRRLLP